jgi:23S rRNA G2069 N7-methylase RlmK/C1962 C5-methylase RlmI
MHSSPHEFSDLENRLDKKHKQLDAWASDAQIEAYRLYHWDIPEYPFYIDRYAQFIVIWDRSEDGKDDRAVIDRMLGWMQGHYRVKGQQVLIKRRFRQEDEQYQKNESTQARELAVREKKLQFWVNLDEYVDTGLFLDHRPLRSELAKISRNRHVLNLFSYTGSLSVASAFGGAERVVSVDLNPNYLDWARRNFKLNHLSLNAHEFIRADILHWLDSPVEEQFDIIVLDPPTFSNSKRTPNVLDLERDHGFLVRACLARLTPRGKLFFSTNKRHFKLEPGLLNDDQYQWKNGDDWSIPRDFDGVRPHRLWTVQRRYDGAQNMGADS